MGRESIKQLNRETAASLTNKDIDLPADDVWQLPEKVLQFGTGVLLRGLPDYYINKANNNGVFGGRVVMVKSTNKGSCNAFAEQDNLYTHCIKGIDANGIVTEKYIINAAISRVIDAGDGWHEVMALAADAQVKIIISNTTEVGIVCDETDNIHALPPRSFPGKLLAFLKARYQAFNGSGESGLVIIPTELITDNGTVLKEIVHRLAKLNSLNDAFINWLLTANDWCSSLVDRIVPGALPEMDNKKMEETLGYTDQLAIMSEPYGLWAIETKKEETKDVLSFSKADKGIIITDNIQKYRELKLRLLNATHTFCCGLAFLYRFETVTEAMQDETFERFVRKLLYQEIVPCLVSDSISRDEADAFAGAVLKRFANPFIHHRWLSISLQYTSKMKARCLPLIARYGELFKTVPQGMMTGFAAYLVFMKAVTEKEGNYYGKRKGSHYLIQDDKAVLFYEAWKNKDAEKALLQTVNDNTIWSHERIALPTFTEQAAKCAGLLLADASLQQVITEEWN